MGRMKYDWLTPDFLIGIMIVLKFIICLICGLLKKCIFYPIRGKKQVYEILFENLVRFSVSEEYCILKKFQMAIYLENKDFIIENWRQIISNLIQQEDYSIAQSLLENAYNLVEI